MNNTPNVEKVRRKFVIASSKAPRKDQVKAFVDQIVDAAKLDDLVVVAMKGRESIRWCYNYGIIMEGSSEYKIVRFIEALTMALMPSRYAECTDPDWEGLYDFEEPSPSALKKD